MLLVCGMNLFDEFHKRRLPSTVFLIFISAAFIWIFYQYDPSTCVFFPKCPVHLLFGIPCPGCGSQRAIHSLLHLDFAKALQYNAFAASLLPILAILIVSSALREKHPSFYRITHHRYIATSFVFLVPLWWILRILFHWYI